MIGVEAEQIIIINHDISRRNSSIFYKVKCMEDEIFV